jgi:hypothetical protein
MKKTVFLVTIFVLLLFLQLISFSQNFAEDLEIKEINNYFDGNWAVIGLIKNKSNNTTYSYTTLSLICRDKNEQMVHTDTTYSFSPIPPNSEIPFLFLTSKENAEDVKTYSVSIDGSQIGGEGTFNFSFSQVSITERASLYDKYSGEIINQTDSLHQYTKIAFIGFDSTGDMIYYDTTYPKKTSLPSKGTSLFEFLIPPHISSKISKYRCIGYAE